VVCTSERSGKESEAFDNDAMEVVRAASYNAATRPPYHRRLPEDGGVGVLSSLDHRHQDLVDRSLVS
jgi:hypothetical protein